MFAALENSEFMAQVDYFLKIDGVQGESVDSKHKGEIDLESFSWGETSSGGQGAGGGGGAGKVSIQDFHFVMKLNKASPKLLREEIGAARLEYRPESAHCIDCKAAAGG